ncbi:hypothetical protein [Vulgatibacter incomptus]|uniref:Essential protein Yae1 N-terminal domain-containing protein n=1 Tax=Vulgatibacter incomptus TaxID=1391653 RepID=A0A0K1PHX6_9BACT|nr:hypothetical protein [Vulgatibacter incomptus]AKU93117.1 hypothetical protein AKJ08_3504 [Vulgatibacter incomptus]
MLSLEHEALVELFRSSPKLAAEAIRAAFDLPLPEGEGQTLESTLNQIVPTELRADLVVAFGDARVIVEVQLARDEDKRWIWPCYVTTLRARERCRSLLLVVTNSAEVARWARRPISLDTPGSSYVPLVLGPGSCPRITDLEMARRLPALTVLSAMVHARDEPDLEVAIAALAGAMALDSDRATIYGDLVLRSMGELAQQVLEAFMSIRSGGYEYQSEFARKYWSKGLEEGLEKGREEGLEKGREEGLEMGQEEGRRAIAGAVVKVLTGRGLPLSESQRSTILDATDLATLDRWLSLALSVGSAEDLLANRTGPTGPAE